ncbi:MAG: peptidase M48 family [Ignavibacteria bacterium]|nr:MAG: peptidase M48 family [Ignavibacteria bacterium]KAF0158892.1 MAG: peptidase M48 family [Ignavibacteria bacterium]
MLKLVKRKKALFIVLSFIVAACSAIQTLNIFPVEQDVALGSEFALQLQNSAKDYPVYNNPALKNYITQNIFKPILNSPDVLYRDIFKYNLEIIKNDTILNAFAVPGGPVYVYTGLLKYLDSEAALAGVLGHEIAHAERRHSTNRMTKQLGLQMLTQLVLGNNPSQTAMIVSNLFSGMALLANSRADEDESDRLSMKYLQSTKYYPGSVKFFFEKMRDDGKVSAGGGGVFAFFSTHPDPIARIASADQRLKDAGIPVKDYRATGAGVFKEEYKKYILSQIK